MPGLYLHETIDIVGQGAVPYMQHTLDATGDETNNFVLQGTWQVMGITSRWPQVVNIWDIPDGWAGWSDSVDRLNLERASNTQLTKWWDEAYKLRAGGVDRLLAGAPTCPSTELLVSAGVRGSLFMHEVAEVRPGSALEYLATVAELRVPLLIEYGFVATGLYETMMTDTEAITVWAGDVPSHTEMMRVEHATRHALDDGDDRFELWRHVAREFVISWREELMTPLPGIRIGPRPEQESDETSES